MCGQKNIEDVIYTEDNGIVQADSAVSRVSTNHIVGSRANVAEKGQ